MIEVALIESGKERMSRAAVSDNYGLKDGNTHFLQQPVLASQSCELHPWASSSRSHLFLLVQLAEK